VSDAEFRYLASSLPIIVWTTTLHGSADYLNDEVERYAGRPKEELLGDRWAALLHPDDADRVVGTARSAMRAGVPYRLHVRLLGADGEYRWFAAAAGPQRDSSGAIVRWWGNATDIHDFQFLREEASARAAERERILESIGDGVFATDHDLCVTYMNGSAEAAINMTREDFVGRRIWEAFPEVTDTEAEGLYRKALAGEPQHFERYNARLDRWFEVSAYPSEHGVTAYFRNVTALKSHASQFAQSQRLEAVGQLTGGIAHDFNNLLTVVVGGSEALASEPGLSDETREMVDLISRAALRGAELTHRLLAFASKQVLRPEAIDLGIAMEHFTALIERTLGADIEIISHVEEGLPLTEVDPGEFENAILNLAINARNAMPEGGRLALDARGVVLDEASPAAGSEILPGSYVVVSVSDTGHGIPHDILAKIFEPFFTTKPHGEGSGLGLAMVWGFAKQSGGNVTVSSEVGLGTTFRLYLPVSTQGEPASASASSYAPPSNRRAARPRTGHVLLAEDDGLVRRFAADRLRSLGYVVTEAASGPEALESLESIPELGLLFTDIIMPGGLTGRDLADAVVALRPGTPVLFASGYAEDVIVHDGRLDPGVDLLTKPYTGSALAERVARAIAGRDSEQGGLFERAEVEPRRDGVDVA
jgi:PAS domain S-box-containing protein